MKREIFFKQCSLESPANCIYSEKEDDFVFAIKAECKKCPYAKDVDDNDD